MESNQIPKQIDESQQPAPWVKAVKKALTNNAQLAFSNIASIAYVHGEGEPGIDNITFDRLEVVSSSTNSSSNINVDPQLLFPIDSRKNTFVEMHQSKVVEICWYFPLTKEQFKIKCSFGFLRGASDAQANLSEDEQAIVKAAWNRLDKEAKKSYQMPHPDTQKPDVEATSDLDRFNCPDKTSVSDNFILLTLSPKRVEHTTFAMPPVVADGRKEFESLFKPYKKHMKFLHTKDDSGAAGAIWKVVAINP